MSRKTPEEWFAEYSVCHQNRANKVIHWVCVPAIAASLIGMLWSIPFPWVTASSVELGGVCDCSVYDLLHSTISSAGAWYGRLG